MALKSTRLTLACFIAAACVSQSVSAVQAAGGQGKNHVVSPGPGTPIQDAVDRAHAGDTIIVRAGKYREAVIVSKPLTIIGSGYGEHGTVLSPPEQQKDNPCGAPSGFCVTSRVQGSPVRDVKIERFRVQDFPGSGIIGIGTEHFTVKSVKAVNNKEYGIASFVGHRTVITRSAATGSQEAGLYIGDSPNAEATVSENNSSGNNGDGLLIRDSTAVTSTSSTFNDNCVGILTASTRGSSSGNIDIRKNKAHSNTRACPAFEEAPVRSGMGIAIGGSHDVRVQGNDVRGNRATGPTLAAGGILVVSTVAFGGADPKNVEVVRNTALNNEPADLVWDLSGSNIVFAYNRHNTSIPPGLN
ncbi:right-handed parallel beta-helix repeat-containing protein [Streptomyces sp. NPDC048362]|uniref:right-handed parallel beta-helix repeat-containing protein n=1 Tax=Streptomyces sp. NPDC048362 TaxID=3365539 RepID=UPI00372499A5